MLPKTQGASYISRGTVRNLVGVHAIVCIFLRNSCLHLLVSFIS